MHDSGLIRFFADSDFRGRLSRIRSSGAAMFFPPSASNRQAHARKICSETSRNVTEFDSANLHIRLTGRQTEFLMI